MDTAVDWGRLARAVEFYKARGYTYVEAPWAAPDEIVAITAPNPEWRSAAPGHGTLVGSAEQGFLWLDHWGHLPKGEYVALTPCWRRAEIVDDAHGLTFMKVELYSNREHRGSIMERMIKDARTFFENELNVMSIGKAHLSKRLLLDEVETSEGVDIELAGVELGSYGVRDGTAGFEHLRWTYGTGLAEPRFTYAEKVCH